MAIRFRCRECRKTLTIASRKAGSLVACPRCGHSMEVPSESTSGPAARRKRRKRRWSSVVPLEPASSLSGSAVGPLPFQAAMPESTEERAAQPPALMDGDQARGSSLERPVLADALERHWIEPAGVLGLLLCGFSLLSASFAATSMLVVPLALTGFVGGLVSCRRMFVDERVMPALPFAAVVLPLFVTLVALLFPGLLGPQYAATKSAPVEVEATSIRPVALRGETLGNLGEWVDASKAALVQGSLRVQVLGAILAPSKLPDKNSRAKAEESLFLMVRTSEILDARGTPSAANDGETPSVPRLLDSAGNVLPFRQLQQAAPEQARRGFPTTLVDLILVFDAPRGAVDHLRFELPAASLGKSGQFRFEIPGRMIRREPRPPLALGGKN